MKKILGIVAFLLIATSAVNAQTSVSAFKKSLTAADSLTGSRITLHEEPSVARMGELSKDSTNIRGFRILLFSGNNQSARANAQSVMRQFTEAFPYIPVYMRYANPDFKVSVGNFLTKDEAIMAWVKINSYFKNALIVPEVIPSNAFGTKSVTPKEQTTEEVGKEEVINSETTF